MKIIFMGSTEGALLCLKKLVDEGFHIEAVITQPDRPAGRGRKIVSPPLKPYALEKGIKIFQPEKIKEPSFFETLKGLSPDLIVVVAYGKILPEEILNLPPMKCINLHASLLPRYRGAAPVNWAIINGEKETGVTTQLMAKELDAGDILLQEKEEIRPNDTAASLLDRLMKKGAFLLVETIRKWEKGEITPQPQDESAVSYAPMLKKEDGLINWHRKAEEIENQVRGTNPWPGAFTYLTSEKKERLKIWSCRALARSYEKEPGSIWIENKRLIITTGSGVVELLEVQPENKKRMKAEQYIQGYKLPDRFF
ncbi:MAG: methionyl-tRNA formyltransferase [Candidatus Schekmanbacteria bacterium]|nr:MAG: methionyl-tRNA formyltransferase [Candidatus Schekmanbacteria bacterium]